MLSSKLVIASVMLLASRVTGFCPVIHLAARPANLLSTVCPRSSKVVLESSRRNFVEQAMRVASISSLIGSVVVLAPPQQVALASGGATAGGAYLLSAKQRYNERVMLGVKGFVSLRTPLESGDLMTLRTFFSDEEKGSWKDFSASGYLLSNAFRRNSSAAPDTLPSVKKWKAFAAKVEATTQALKKKDTKGGLSAYSDALVALDEYLVQVELPSAKEISIS